MTIEEIKEWRNTVETHGIGIAGEFVVEIIDALLEGVERLEKHNAYADQYNAVQDLHLTIATEALEEIITDGDYTAPEGMKLIARTALERIKECEIANVSQSELIERLGAKVATKCK